MSLRRPTVAALQDPFSLADILAGYYDALIELERLTANTSTVTATFAAGATDVRVRHGLPALQGWEVIDRDADANVWRSATVNVDPRVIILQASAPVVAKLRFF